MKYRSTLAASIAVLGAAMVHPAEAQMTWTQPAPPGTPGWTFAITPYFWLATIRSNLNFNTPQGTTVTDEITAGINDYITHLNFAAMVGAEARYDRFAVMTDVVFTSFSFTTNNSDFTRLRFPSGSLDIPRQLQATTGTRLNAGVWNMAGAYTVVQQAWGNVDVLGGFRLLGVGNQTNYSLDAQINLPNQTLGLARSGSLALGADFVDAIVGVRGRVNIPNSRWFVPYYLDIGSAGVPLTWQAYIGIGYQTSIADLSLGYRYLDFQGNGDRAVRNLSLGGAILAASFRF